MAERGEYRAIRRVLLDGKDFQKLSERARFVFVALKINIGPAGIDVMYPEALVAQLSAQIGAPAAGTKKALTELERGGWIEREANVLWICEQLQFDPHMSVTDRKHRIAIQRHIAGLPSLPIVERYRNRYADWFEGPFPSESEPNNGPTEGLQTAPVAQDNNKTENKTENKTNTTSVDLLFERFWRDYPKRAGNNPRRKAEQAWSARLEEKCDPESILAGEQRYIAFLKATGKVGTEYVMQASTFVGPNRCWEQAWDAPKSKAPAAGQQFQYDNSTNEFKGFAS